MRVLESLAAIDPADFPVGSCVAIGKFDGVHLGHRAILARVRDAARAAGRSAVVVTFANHPLSYLRPEACPLPLTSPEQRIEAFAEIGIDVCVMLDFDEALASIPAEEFVTDVLVGRLGAREIVMGADFRFGHRGAGDAALLRSLGGLHGFAADAVEWVGDGADGPVSSSRIRDAIASGDVAAASRMLGREPAVRGTVVHGDARGRELGFPTANLGGRIEGLVPADGVYAGWAILGGERLPTAISVGNNPTFTPEGQSRVEAFLLDFDRDIYGEPIEIRFAHRLRGTVRFESLESLIEQMDADVVRARRLLGVVN